MEKPYTANELREINKHLIDSKICNKCFVEKPRENFYPVNRKGKKSIKGTYVSSECKDCRRMLKHTVWYPKELERLKNIRLETIGHYGGKCINCGIEDYRFLALDHINNNGFEDRKAGFGKNMAIWARRNNFPDFLQLLCHSCNYLKRFFGGNFLTYEITDWEAIYLNPPTDPKDTPLKKETITRRKLKLQILKDLGGACVFCGDTRYPVLSIDHIHNDGNVQRKLPGRNNTHYYIYKTGDKEPFQLLCTNCNMAKAFYGYSNPTENKNNIILGESPSAEI